MGDTFPISGSIDPKSFPFLLTDLHRNGATGSLKIEGPSYQKALYFRAGRILFGSSNDPRDQLGAILIENGKITPEQLEDVNTKVGPGSPLAKVLAETGFVSQRELSEAARSKVERILSDVIGYTSGTFEFEDGVLPKGAVDLKLATDALVVSATRALADRNFVLRHLEGLGSILAASPVAPEAPADLPPEANALLQHLDGQSTLKEVAARTRLEEFDAAKVACALLFLGLVARRDVPGPAPDVEVASEVDLGETARAALDEPDTANPFFVAAPPVAAAGFEEVEVELPPPPAAPPVVPQPQQPAVAVTPPEEPSEIAIEPPKPARAQALPLVPPPPRTKTPATPPGPPTERSVPAFPSPFDRPAAPTATPKRPSRDELAALDALLDSRPVEGPLEPLGKRSEPEWAPNFGHAAGGGPRGAAGKHRVLVIALAAAGLVLALGAAWYFLRPSVLPRPQRTPATAIPPPSLAVPTTEASASPLPTPSGAASAGPASPTPAASAAPTPAPKVTPPLVTGGLAEARGLLQGGRYDDAARSFLAHTKASPPGTATIQILVACSSETVQKAVASAGEPELFIVPVNFKGRDCYRLCWGLYPSESAASSAMGALPAYFLQGGAKPRVVTAREIQP